jgi:hypothetical protein
MRRHGYITFRIQLYSDSDPAFAPKLKEEVEPGALNVKGAVALSLPRLRDPIFSAAPDAAPSSELGVKLNTGDTDGFAGFASVDAEAAALPFGLGLLLDLPFALVFVFKPLLPVPLDAALVATSNLKSLHKANVNEYTCG